MMRSILKALDLEIDGVAGADSGIFRHEGFACKKGMVYDKSLSPSSI
ncbi:MAG: hypothetical protein GY793_03215 [Proteobacteria bacterium]|nr:hypothetical protein [Pseudomonadota bacterium]